MFVCRDRVCSILRTKLPILLTQRRVKDARDVTLYFRHPFTMAAGPSAWPGMMTHNKVNLKPKYMSVAKSDWTNKILETDIVYLHHSNVAGTSDIYWESDSRYVTCKACVL